MSEWKELYLEEVGTLARGKSKHRPRWAPELYGGKYPFIQTGQITAAHKYINSIEQTYSEEGLKQSKLWKKGTLCITIAANIAELAILSFPACFPDSVLGFQIDEDKADLDFVFYTLTLFQNRLKSMSIGSVQDNINLETFKNIQFPFPDLDEQKEIGRTLSLLDQKITLLRQQNQDLEELAQTLFKRWFVEFEFPDENGEPYKSSGGKMVECELGEIPEGWRVGKLGDIYKTTSGGTPSRQIDDYYNLNGIPWIKSKELENIYVIETEEYISEIGLKNSSAKLLPKDTILVAMYGATVGQLSLTSKDKMTCNQAICAILEGEYSFPFCLLLLKHYKKDWTGLAIGSAQQNLSQVTISGYEIIIPSIQIELKFTQVIKPLYHSIKNNFKEIHSLTQLRDTLLPKLMSGELRVSE